MDNSVFNYIKPPANVANNSIYLGNGYFRKPDRSENKIEAVSSFRVGVGKNSIKMNPEQGQWWGGDKLEEARASMDPNGNFTFRDENGVPTILIGETTLK